MRRIALRVLAILFGFFFTVRCWQGRYYRGQRGDVIRFQRSLSYRNWIPCCQSKLETSGEWSFSKQDDLSCSDSVKVDSWVDTEETLSTLPPTTFSSSNNSNWRELLGVDESRLFLHLHAGTGGQEAALVTTILLRAYLGMAQKLGWVATILGQIPRSLEPDGLVGVPVLPIPAEGTPTKSIFLCVEGSGVWDAFQWEVGVHKTQRVPPTETQGRTHSATISVQAIPAFRSSQIVDRFNGKTGSKDISVDRQDLVVSATRASGPGGQSVNKASSAVHVRHRLTGISVFVQKFRSQRQNLLVAIDAIREKLIEMRDAKRTSWVSAVRSQGSGGRMSRAERIRSYQWKEGRAQERRLSSTSRNFPLTGVLSGQDLIKIHAALAEQCPPPPPPNFD